MPLASILIEVIYSQGPKGTVSVKLVQQEATLLSVTETVATRATDSIQ